MVSNIRLRTPSQQRGRHPVEPLRFLGRGLHFREARDVRAVHRPESLQRELADVCFFIQHALADRHEQLGVNRARRGFRDVAHRAHRGDADILFVINQTVLEVPRDFLSHGGVSGGAGGEKLRAPPAHLDANFRKLVPEPPEKLREVVRVVLRHGASGRGERAAEQLHGFRSRFRVIVLQLFHYGGPHRDERGGVHHGERFQDVRAALAQRVFPVPLAAQGIHEKVLHRELQVVLGFAHQRAREVVRRGVLSLERLHQALQNSRQNFRRHLLRFLQHRAQHLRRVFLDERAVRGVHARKQHFEKLRH